MIKKKITPAFQLLFVCVVYRVVIVLLARTSYVPDEYYQFQEPVSQLVFDKGIETWEWMSNYRIRSYITLLPLVLTFKAASYLNFTPLSLTFSSRLFHTALVLVSDWCFIRLIRISPCRKPYFAVLLNLLSWSGSFMLCRSIANSLEYTFFLIGSYLIIQYMKTSLKTFIVSAFALVVLSIYLRPTAVLFWTPCLIQLFWTRSNSFKATTVLTCLGIGATIILFCIFIDSTYYQTFTVPPMNFFYFNIMEKKAEVFGVKPWHFNITEGLPVIFGLYFPIVLLFPIYGRMKNQYEPLKMLVNSAIFYIISLGLVTRHQEHRFLLPIIPYFHLAIASVIEDNSLFASAYRRKIWERYLSLSVLIHVLLALTLLTYHQKGGEEIFHKLRTVYAPSIGSTSHIILNAPCYSFPGYAALVSSHSSFELYLPNCGLPWAKGANVNEESEFYKVMDKAKMAAKQSNDLLFLVQYDGFYKFASPTDYGFTLMENITHAHLDFDFDEDRPMQRILLYKFV